MSILDRYVLRGVVGGTALVLLVLLGIGTFIAMVGQLDDVGTGGFTLPNAIGYVLLTLPVQAYTMFPVATMLGALLGLGNLASNSELVVMRAAGVSPWRLARSVLLAGVILAGTAAALGEFIAPPAEQYAQRSRTLAMHDELSLSSGQSGWIRDGNVVVNISRLMEGDRAGGIYVFTFDDERRLSSVARARGAGFDDEGRWVLDEVSRSVFQADGVIGERQRELVQPTRLSPSLLDLSVVDPDSLAIRGLWSYIGYLRANGLDFDRYLVAFWGRIATLVSVVAMAVLALPFVFGPLRATGSGQRMLAGVLIGVTYFLANRTLANSGAVYGLDPTLTAWLPSLVLCSITVLALARVR